MPSSFGDLNDLIALLIGLTTLFGLWWAWGRAKWEAYRAPIRERNEKRNAMYDRFHGFADTVEVVLPILQRLAGRPVGKPRPIRCLVLTPTRELASQIGESFSTYGKHLPLRNTVIFGGVGMDAQRQALRAGMDILVATPGRLLDRRVAVGLPPATEQPRDEIDDLPPLDHWHDDPVVVAAPGAVADPEPSDLVLGHPPPHQVGERGDADRAQLPG